MKNLIKTLFVVPVCLSLASCERPVADHVVDEREVKLCFVPFDVSTSAPMNVVNSFARVKRIFTRIGKQNGVSM